MADDCEADLEGKSASANWTFLLVESRGCSFAGSSSLRLTLPDSCGTKAATSC